LELDLKHLMPEIAAFAAYNWEWVTGKIELLFENFRHSHLAEKPLIFNFLQEKGKSPGLVHFLSSGRLPPEPTC